MSNLDEVRVRIDAKFRKALWESDEGDLVLPFVRLALLDQQAVFEAILLQRQAQEKQVDLRTYEWVNGQIARLNDWLAEHEPSLYIEPGTDTGEAMVKAADRLRGQVVKLRHELATAIDERNAADRACAEVEEDLYAAREAHASVCEQRDSLQVQLLQLDADNARLLGEVQRLNSWTLAVQNGNGKSTPAATVVQAIAPAAFVVASEEAEDYRDGLNNGRWKWVQVPKRIRLELVRSVIAATANHTQSEFDAMRPAWMATASAHCAAFGAAWRELADLSHEIEVKA